MSATPNRRRQTTRRRTRLPEDEPGIVRRNFGRNHAYYIDGRKVPGVTTISGYIKGGGLMDYTGKVVARAAVNDWEALSELPPADRLDALVEARWAERDAAAGRGTEVHKIGRRLSLGEEVEVPDELRGHIEAYRDWLDKNQAKVLWTELVVANRTVRYCGTLDAIMDLPEMICYGGEIIPAARWLVDLKTSKSGVFPESALQCVGYRRAEIFIDPDQPEESRERPMEWLGIERCGIVHVRYDSCELIPLDTSARVWDYFEALAWIYHRDEQRKEWVGAAAEPLLAAAPAAAPHP